MRRTPTRGTFIGDVALDHAESRESTVTLDLRCYAYRDGDAWEAICVDLDIAAFGPSLDEVKNSLAICIEIYLERVAELPAHEQSYFLTRKSPWPLRAKFGSTTWFSRLGGAARRFRGFSFQHNLPAVP